jgi:hypothetical protein
MNILMKNTKKSQNIIYYKNNNDLKYKKNEKKDFFKKKIKFYCDIKIFLN